VYDDQGRLVAQTFSADKVKAIVAAELQKAINPLNEDLKTRQQREQDAAQLRQVETRVVNETQRIGKRLSALPGYADYEPAIKARIAEIAKTDRESTPEGIAYQAYLDVVKPNVASQAKAEVLDSLKQKAAAQMPAASGSTASPVTRPRNAKELEQFLKHQHAAAR
jgi:hypothetical protein